MPLQGKPYRPNVVRIGSEEAPLAQRARDVWVDGLIRQYTHLHPEAHGQKMSQHIRAATQLSRTIAEIVTRLAETHDQVSKCNIRLLARALSIPESHTRDISRAALRQPGRQISGQGPV